jgi:transcription elongation GreA/GreB family factor
MKQKLSPSTQIAFKKSLLAKCAALIEHRINAAEISITNAQAAANAEEKSSAGDKYETSRAMSHLEKDMHARQLSANRSELAALQRIDCSVIHESATIGSYVQCANCSFFVAAGLGKILFEGVTIYLLSPFAPFAKILMKKTPGDKIHFNNTEMTIEVVF